MQCSNAVLVAKGISAVMSVLMNLHIRVINFMSGLINSMRTLMNFMGELMILMSALIPTTRALMNFMRWLMNFASLLMELTNSLMKIHTSGWLTNILLMTWTESTAGFGHPALDRMQSRADTDFR